MFRAFFFNGVGFRLIFNSDILLTGKEAVMRNTYQLTGLLLAIFILWVTPFSAADGGQSLPFQITGGNATAPHLDLFIAKERAAYETKAVASSDFVSIGDNSASIYVPPKRSVRLLTELPFTALRHLRVPSHPFLLYPRRIK